MSAVHHCDCLFDDETGTYVKVCAFHSSREYHARRDLERERAQPSAEPTDDRRGLTQAQIQTAVNIYRQGPGQTESLESFMRRLLADVGDTQ